MRPLNARRLWPALLLLLTTAMVDAQETPTQVQLKRGQTIEELAERLFDDASAAAEIRALRLHSPVNRMTALRQHLDFQRATLASAIQRRLGEMRMNRSLLEKRINDLNPLSVLKRGYSITRKLPEKRVLKNVSGVGRGDQVEVLLGEGALGCRVDKVGEGMDTD